MALLSSFVPGITAANATKANTFAACGLSPDRAESGRHLVELVADHKAHIVTTLVHKFDKALNFKKFTDDSPDIFVLVDETQRTQLGGYSARMRQMFSRACYIGFTGTPLLTREKSDVSKFGGIIHTYLRGFQVTAPVINDRLRRRLMWESPEPKQYAKRIDGP